MGKIKIQKNRSLEEMFDGYQEETTFENAMYGDEPAHKVKVKQKAKRNMKAADFRAEFFTDELQETIGRILFDIRMEYYKDGFGDISLEAVKDGRTVVIRTAPKKKKD